MSQLYFDNFCLAFNSVLLKGLGLDRQQIDPNFQHSASNKPFKNQNTAYIGYVGRRL